MEREGGWFKDKWLQVLMVCRTTVQEEGGSKDWALVYWQLESQSQKRI